MISSGIKKRTQQVNKQLNQVWCEKWMDFVLQHPEHPWNWCMISRNSSLTMKYVEQHPEHPWHWNGISWNSTLTMEFVEQHLEHPWNWSGISCNSTLTMEYVEQHPEHPWNWNGISCNDFKKAKKTFLEKKYKEHLSAFKIQQWFHHIKLNPNYNYCRKQVNMFYDRYLS